MHPFKQIFLQNMKHPPMSPNWPNQFPTNSDTWYQEQSHDENSNPGFHIICVMLLSISSAKRLI